MRDHQSPYRRRSSPKASSQRNSHGVRSPARERESPKRRSSRSPAKINPPHSTSPRTKRLKRPQAEHSADKSVDSNHRRKDGKNEVNSREEHVRERHKERDNNRGAQRDRRSSHEDGCSGSSENERRRHKEQDDHRDAPRGKKSTHEDERDGRDDNGKRRLKEQDNTRNKLSNMSTRDKIDGRFSISSKHDYSASPVQRHHRSSYDSRSPPRASRAGARDEVTNSRTAGQNREEVDDSIAKMRVSEDALEAKEKQKPSFELSGKLAEETNRVRGVTLLFNEPPDACKPDIRWRLYVFKAGDVLNEPLYVHRQSCYLFGRERRVADIPTDHPSCSKQHAVLQYRLVEKEQRDGMMAKQVRPYMMDLGSTNGTFVNENRIEPQRYYELFEKDTIKFGNSSREYVLLHENSKA